MITATALTKSYGSARVVRDVSLRCEPGTITGFLGPNGAGKSTTLKMIVGLARPDHGTSTVGGQPFVDLPNPTRVVGTLLDPSAMHAGRTGRATLTIAARMAGVPIDRVEQLLDRVGLAEAADLRVGGYSLGMRQRLGIAQTLVGDPEVLILDEPANGLDPEGIVWMRGLLRDFAERGGTVLLSSHLLHEVQATVDHLVVISHGAVVASGRLDDLLATTSLLVRSPDTDALGGALQAAGIGYAPGPDQTRPHRRRARRPGHPGDSRACRISGAGASHRAAGFRLERTRAAVLLPHRDQGEPLTGGCSMTTTTTRPVLTSDATLPAATFTGIPFARLVRVEWGKATETRAARWLLAAVAATIVGLMTPC